MFMKGHSVKSTLTQASKMVMNKPDTYIRRNRHMQIKVMKRPWEVRRNIQDTPKSNEASQKESKLVDSDIVTRLERLQCTS